MPSIRITTDHPRSSYGVPVCILGRRVVDDADGLTACMDALGWGRRDLAEHTGKSLSAVDQYRRGDLPVPAEVWLVLRDALAN